MLLLWATVQRCRVPALADAGAENTTARRALTGRALGRGPAPAHDKHEKHDKHDKRDKRDKHDKHDKHDKTKAGKHIGRQARDNARHNRRDTQLNSKAKR